LLDCQAVAGLAIAEARIAAAPRTVNLVTFNLVMRYLHCCNPELNVGAQGRSGFSHLAFQTDVNARERDCARPKPM
jgi:hypothetical protein